MGRSRFRKRVGVLPGYVRLDERQELRDLVASGQGGL